MKTVLFIFFLLITITVYSQNLAIGHSTPVAKLDIRGGASVPALPGPTSFAMLRIGVNENEGIDIGKSPATPWAAWIQSGFGGYIPDPLCLQPLGGNVGIGVMNPAARLDVSGNVKVAGKITNVMNPTAPQDMATKAYVDLLQPQITQLQTQYVKDVEKNQYEFVTIGSQVWMTENLRVTSFTNGNNITLITDPTAWANATVPAYTWYNNGDSEYGALYNFYAASTAGLCPTGWHVPTDAEITTLTSNLGSGPGGKMKESGLFHWNTPNVGAINSSGFTALPGGYRLTDGFFDAIGSHGAFWTKSSIDPSHCWYFFTWTGSDNCSLAQADNNVGFSVRCVKN